MLIFYVSELNTVIISNLSINVFVYKLASLKDAEQ
jgi:hypothetical protein